MSFGSFLRYAEFFCHYVWLMTYLCTSIIYHNNITCNSMYNSHILLDISIVAISIFWRNALGIHLVPTSGYKNFWRPLLWFLCVPNDNFFPRYPKIQVCAPHFSKANGSKSWWFSGFQNSWSPIWRPKISSPFKISENCVWAKASQTSPSKRPLWFCHPFRSGFLLYRTKLDKPYQNVENTTQRNFKDEQSIWTVMAFMFGFGRTNCQVMSGYQFPGRNSKKMVQVAMAQLQGRQEVPLELPSAFLEFLFQLFFHFVEICEWHQIILPESWKLASSFFPENWVM